MTAPTIMKKGLRGLEPDNDLARQILSKLKPGEPVRVDIKRPRSLPWHRRYWALVSLIAENSSYTPDEVHQLLKLRCGCTKVIHERSGNTVTLPDSIAFDRMDAEAWTSFWNRVVDYGATHLIGGITKEALQNEIAELLGIPNTMTETK